MLCYKPYKCIKDQRFIYRRYLCITMQDMAYDTTEIILRASDIHDIDSYITLMRHAWVGYSMHIIFACIFGGILGMILANRIYNSEVLHKWIQKQTWIQKSK